MATMEKAPRIVRCPKCLALLQEPPPGTPLYKCGNCSTVLRAKHASADASGARRASARAPQLNRATPPIHADSNDARKLPSKPVPVDLTSRQANLDDPVDNRNRIGNPRLTPADTEKISPSHLHHHRISPPGPTPTYVPINSTNTYADNVFRTGQDHHRLVPRDPLASPSSRDEEGFLRGSRPTPIYLLQTKVPTPALVEKSPNYMHHNIQSPPSDQLRNPCDATDEKEGLADMRTRSSPGNVNVTIRQKSPPADLVAEGRARVCQGTPEVEADLTSFSPTKALAALRNAGPLEKVKRRHELGLGPTSKLPTCNAQGALTRGRNKSQGDESMVTENAESGPSTGLHRRQRSDGVAISERCAHENDLYVGNPALYAGRRWSVEDEVKAVDKFPEEPTSVPRVPGNERRALHNVEVTMEKEQCRDDPSIARVDEENVTPEEISIARASSSDISSQLNETTINASIPKTITIDQALGIQQNEPDLKATLQHKEKLVVSKDTFDDDEDDEPETLLGEDEERSPSTLSPRMSRKPLSPPHFLSSESAIGGVRPQSEHMSKSSYADQPRQESDAPSSLQDFHGLPDVLDYDTSEDSSNADDADPYQITSKPHSEELKSPTLSSHSGQVMLPDAAGVNSERSDDDDQEPTDTRSPNSQSQAHVGLIGSPYFASHRSPESIHSESPTPQTHTPDQLKQEPQGTAPESTSSFSFGQGGGQMQQGSAYSSLRGQTQKVRLEINTPVPERIHVRCGHCNLQLEVPPNLTRSETGVQKLRCGSCWRISRFRLNHLLLSHTSGVSSPAGSDRASPESSFQLGSSDGTTSGRYSGTRSNRETGTQERVVIRTGHNPRAASGSKLSNMVSVSTMSTPNTSGDLVTPIPKDMTLVDMSPSAEPSHATTSLSPTLSSISQQKTTASPDRRLLQSSSDSDEVEKASTTAQLKIGPTTFNNNPTRMTSWSAPEAGPEFDDGHEFKGLKGFLKKSVKELTKGKKSTQYRRKVVVNGHAVPDDVVRRAEEYAGGIHPGSYWYDFRAGFWGVMGGPCLGMILPSIEELNFPLARHCSHGKTGVLVNGRELHHRDLELLKKRGLPGTPGKAYNVDIDGRLTEETTGIELKGLGRLAPTLEQTGRGPGMWVPESQRG